MHISESDIPQLDDASLQVLRSYAESAAAAREADADFSGWTNRLMTVESIEAAELTRIHGQLIAVGCLKFEMSNRDVGMQYQLSQLARSVLARASRTNDVTDSDEELAVAVESSEADTASVEPEPPVSDEPKPLSVPEMPVVDLERAA